MAYLVLARKWRPQTFDDLVGQEHVARILKNAITNSKVAHAYIFSGPRGVGKTSTARILAKALNCIQGPTPDPCGTCPSCTAVADGSSIDVSEIDGASNTGVDNIRDLRERIRYAPSESRYKIYIIDEAHMLSTSAFNALLKTLEEPPPHVIFVLATTEPKKIPPTVLSRCQHLPFKRISGQQIKGRLKVIADAEKINIAGPALDMIARAAEGSMRDALTILDQIVSFTENITAAEVKDLLGITDTETLSRLTAAVIEGNRKEIVNLLAGLTDTGADLKAFTRDLLQFIRNLLIAKIVDEPEGIVELSEEEVASIGTIKDSTTEEHLALILSELIKAEPGIRGAFYPRIALEMALLRLSFLNHLTMINEALRVVQGADTDDRRVSRTLPAGSEKKNEQIVSESKSNRDIPVPPTHPRRFPERNTPLPDLWNKVLDAIDETNHPLASKLRDGKASFAADEITIVFNGGMSVHVESVKENLPAIRDMIKERSGKTVSFKIETAKSTGISKKELKEKALRNPVVVEALELFEGRIIDVIPMNNKSEMS